jgi:epoxyqueuosine reductase
MKQQIQEKALELGFDDCRVTTAAAPESGPHFKDWLAEGRHGAMAYLERNAFKRLDPQLVLPGAKSVIVLAASYHSHSELQHSSASGQIARYAQFEDYHDVLGARFKQLALYIDTFGGRSLWYVDTGPVLERDFAQRAGLGFVGKHTNLISRQFGNWIFLAEILTTLELPPDVPEKNRCGKCSRCIIACPTGAITAPFQLDSRRCISYLTIEWKGPIPVELRPAIGNRIYGCDDCLAACPWNRCAREGKLMKAHARSDLAQPDLIELLALNDAGFKEKFKGTPILRTKRRGLLRNVCVALGNIGDTAALPALDKACHDPEPLIAEHAQWSMNQISVRTAIGDT